MGNVTTLAGDPTTSSGHMDGVGSAASFRSLWGVVVDGAGTFAVVVRLMMGRGAHMRGGLPGWALAAALA